MENEVLVSSDASGQSWNCSIWDYSTGTSLRTLKGGVSAPRTLSLIGHEYVISAEPGKPIINIWPLFKKDQTHLKIVSPGRVSVLTVTPDGTFCIGAVGEKLHIWQISTGELLSVISHHYQSVTCLKTTDDGAFFISAGEDSLVLVWKLGKRLHAALNSTVSGTHNAPYYTWAHHSLPVTDVHIGKGGRRARVVTVSLDHTCRLYSLRTGELLLTVVMEVSILAVTMDLPEFFIFNGGSDGRIFQINLLEPPPKPEHHFSSNGNKSATFHGHIKAVTSLAVSMDCQVLVSGSDDQLVKIWNIPSQQCLRSLSHKGPITNVILIPALQSIISTVSVKSKLNVQPFCCYMCGTDNLEGTWEHMACVTLPPNRPLDSFKDICTRAKKLLQEETLEMRSLILQVDELQKLNDELYTEAVNKILDS